MTKLNNHYSAKQASNMTPHLRSIVIKTTIYNMVHGVTTYIPATFQFTKKTRHPAKETRHPGMLLAGSSVQTRLWLKTYRSDGGAKIHRLNDHGYRFRLQATGMTEGANTGMTGGATAGMMVGEATGITRVRGLVRTTTQSLQSGFTLLEMVLVLFLIGLMASATLMLTENVEDQAKYDETKRRMQMMRTAIVGDPTRTINGSPEISGFVADMGRLPLCVAELLELGAEKSPNTNPKTYDSPCDASETIAVFDIDTSTGLGAGWRGPYIQVLTERNGDLRFRDGYGNSDASDALNSGWSYDVSTATGTISLVSKGFDPVGGTDLITENQLVVSADWEVELPATVNVTFKNQSAGDLPISNENLVLRIYLSDLTTGIDGDNGINDYLILDASSAIAGSLKTKNFTLNSTPTIPIGNRAYSIVCYEEPATGDPDDYVIFDGDCEAANDDQDTSNIRMFSVTPRQSLNLNLDWIIQ